MRGMMPLLKKSSASFSRWEANNQTGRASGWHSLIRRRWIKKLRSSRPASPTRSRHRVLRRSTVNSATIRTSKATLIGRWTMQSCRLLFTWTVSLKRKSRQRRMSPSFVSRLVAPLRALITLAMAQALASPLSSRVLSWASQLVLACLSLLAPRSWPFD